MLPEALALLRSGKLKLAMSGRLVRHYSRSLWSLNPDLHKNPQME
jgi:hypothetical protein